MQSSSTQQSRAIFFNMRAYVWNNGKIIADIPLPFSEIVATCASESELVNANTMTELLGSAITTDVDVNTCIYTNLGVMPLSAACSLYDSAVKNEGEEIANTRIYMIVPALSQVVTESAPEDLPVFVTKTRLINVALSLLPDTLLSTVSKLIQAVQQAQETQRPNTAAKLEEIIFNVIASIAELKISTSVAVSFAKRCINNTCRYKPCQNSRCSYEH
jgi:hypothetical protein